MTLLNKCKLYIKIIDKKALLLAARRTGYGNEFESRIGCEHCGSSSDVEFTIDITIEIPDNTVYDEDNNLVI